MNLSNQEKKALVEEAQDLAPKRYKGRTPKEIWRDIKNCLADPLDFEDAQAQVEQYIMTQSYSSPRKEPTVSEEPVKETVVKPKETVEEKDIAEPAGEEEYSILDLVNSKKLMERLAKELSPEDAARMVVWAADQKDLHEKLLSKITLKDAKALSKGTVKLEDLQNERLAKEETSIRMKKLPWDKLKALIKSRSNYSGSETSSGANRDDVKLVGKIEGIAGGEEFDPNKHGVYGSSNKYSARTKEKELTGQGMINRLAVDKESIGKNAASNEPLYNWLTQIFKREGYAYPVGGRAVGSLLRTVQAEILDDVFKQFKIGGSTKKAMYEHLYADPSEPDHVKYDTYRTRAREMGIARKAFEEGSGGEKDDLSKEDGAINNG